MKQQEEANRIIEMFDNVQGNMVNVDLSKQCAILHVEGIIKEINSFIKFYEDNGLINSDLSCQHLCYWQEVLEIIKNK
jgi:hypothetical protein